MPEADESRKEKQYYTDVPQKSEAFFLKGSNSLDWGMKNRLSNIFDPKSGRTVMLAFDHGYFQGPTTGLERVDVNIVPLAPHADTLMLTRGILRTVIPPSYNRGIVLRASGGPSILRELSNENLAIDIDEAIRLNASAMAVQVFVGGEHETRSIHARDATAGAPVDRRNVAARRPGDDRRSVRRFPPSRADTRARARGRCCVGYAALPSLRSGLRRSVSRRPPSLRSLGSVSRP